LLLQDALYAPEMRCSPISFVYDISFLFNFCLDVLHIVYNDNLFGHATLKVIFNVLDKIEHLLSLSPFQLCFRHAWINHESQDKVIKLAKYDLWRPTHWGYVAYVW